MTDEEQEARSMKWEPKNSVTLRQLSTGNFAMYPAGGVSSPFWIGPATNIASAYASRPPPAQRSHIPTKNKITKHGINLSNLEINI